LSGDQRADIVLEATRDQAQTNAPRNCAANQSRTTCLGSTNGPVPFADDAGQKERGRLSPSHPIGISGLSRSERAVISEKQRGYACREESGGKTSIKMASDQPAPPVPYTRLKEITENACDAALSGVTTYSHPDTESWNTTIINSILGALVEETVHKLGSASSPSQPQFKYVVNSTIIQHAAASATSGDDPKKISGRRGMHAASGAYWNNEKDGMWSFKYPGAESKGLDVVIGIIWIWVG